MSTQKDVIEPLSIESSFCCLREILEPWGNAPWRNSLYNSAVSYPCPVVCLKTCQHPVYLRKWNLLLCQVGTLHNACIQPCLSEESTQAFLPVPSEQETYHYRNSPVCLFTKCACCTVGGPGRVVMMWMAMQTQKRRTSGSGELAVPTGCRGEL